MKVEVSIFQLINELIEQLESIEAGYHNSNFNSQRRLLIVALKSFKKFF